MDTKKHSLKRSTSQATAPPPEQADLESKLGLSAEARPAAEIVGPAKGRNDLDSQENEQDSDTVGHFNEKKEPNSSVSYTNVLINLFYMVYAIIGIRLTGKNPDALPIVFYNVPCLESVLSFLHKPRRGNKLLMFVSIMTLVCCCIVIIFGIDGSLSNEALLALSLSSPVYYAARFAYSLTRYIRSNSEDEGDDK